MANYFNYSGEQINIGDTVTVHYKFKEAEDKERVQMFQGIVIKIRGATEQMRTFTVRKVSKANIGVERIIPVLSPYIAKITLEKKSSYSRAKAYFVRELSQAKLKKKLYRKK